MRKGEEGGKQEGVGKGREEANKEEEEKEEKALGQ